MFSRPPVDSVLGVGSGEVGLSGGSKLTTICIWRAEWAFHPVGDVLLQKYAFIMNMIN